MTKARVDINCGKDTFEALQAVIEHERLFDQRELRPPRSKSEIYEWILKLGLNHWQARIDNPPEKPALNRSIPTLPRNGESTHKDAARKVKVGSELK